MESADEADSRRWRKEGRLRASIAGIWSSICVYLSLRIVRLILGFRSAFICVICG